MSDELKAIQAAQLREKVAKAIDATIIDEMGEHCTRPFLDKLADASIEALNINQSITVIGQLTMALMRIKLSKDHKEAKLIAEMVLHGLNSTYDP